MKEMSEQQQVVQTEKESASATKERLATENILLKRKLTLTQKESSNQSNMKLFEEEIKRERERYLEH